MQRAPCNLALFPFPPFSAPSPRASLHRPPPLSSPPLGPPDREVYFYRGRTVEGYVACVHHAPVASVPPIGPRTAGHFGPFGGCAFNSPLCLSLGAVTFECVGAAEKDRSCARVFHERPGTSGARRNGRAEPSTRAQLVFLEIFTNLPAQSGSLGRGTKRHRFVRANFRSGSVSHQDPRNRGATRRVSESCTPYPEMYERSPARGEWRGVSGK